MSVYNLVLEANEKNKMLYHYNSLYAKRFFYWIIYGHMILDNYVFSDNLKISLTQQSTFTTPILIQQTCDNSIATLDNLYFVSTEVW